MKLRVPEYYSDFVCTADRCKDSCCIGWEIDIDEDTRVYYNSIPGPFGERLRQHMFSTEDEDVFHFELQKKGHCPFLNDTNLCEICIELGEEALSEVCTEYPRFSLAYGDVLQKVLSLSCEEAGRLLFSKKEPLRFVEMGEIGEFERMEEESEERLQFFEYVQDTGIELLQERSRSLGERIERFLGFAEQMQSRLNSEQLDCPLSEEELENCCAQRASFWSRGTIFGWKFLRSM